MRVEKQLLKDGIQEQINRHGSFIIVSYKAFTANQANQFRGAIAKLGGDVEFLRKRVLIKAAKDLGVELNLADLPGHIGLVLAGNDSVETTKLVFKFKKELNNAIDVVGGRFDGRLYNADSMEKLSNLPGIKEMQAQFLSVLEAPLSQTLAVMDALVSSIVYCLDNKSKESSE